MDDDRIDHCFNRAFLCYESILKQEFDEVPSVQTLANLEGLHADALNDALEELERMHLSCDQTLGTLKQHRTELISQAQKAFETRRLKIANADLKEEHKEMSEQEKLAGTDAQPLRPTDWPQHLVKIRPVTASDRQLQPPSLSTSTKEKTGTNPNRRVEMLEEAREISSKLFAMANLELNNISTAMDPEFERLESLLDSLEDLDDRNRGIPRLTK